jgi:hypothetical protein
LCYYGSSTFTTVESTAAGSAVSVALARSSDELSSRSLAADHSTRNEVDGEKSKNERRKFGHLDDEKESLI